ncbi:MAG: hypothetical protein K9G49_12665 [Taibaiella sp.]|nr:hypothetical protein [Taibaiella sp.]
MTQNKRNEPADMLDHIIKMDAPPFLFTRIRQKIAVAREQRITPALAWVGAVSFTIILSVNVYIVAGNTDSKTSGKASKLAQSMNLYPQNSLYE